MGKRTIAIADAPAPMTLHLTAGTFLGRPGQPMLSPAFCLLESHYSRGEVLPRHSHEHGHFCLVLAGGSVEQVGLQQWERGPLSVAWYPPEAEHAEQHLVSGQHLLLEVRPELLTDVPLPAEPRFLGDGAASKAAQRIWVKFRAGDAGAVESLVYELLAYATNLGRERGREPAWLTAIDEQLRVRFVDPPRVTELAQSAGVHPVYLSRVFRRYRGESIADAVRGHRVCAAMRGMAQVGATLAGVATAVGFADQSHMTRAFQTVLHTTPGRWQRISGRN